MIGIMTGMITNQMKCRGVRLKEHIGNAIFVGMSGKQLSQIDHVWMGIRKVIESINDNAIAA